MCVLGYLTVHCFLLLTQLFEGFLEESVRFSGLTDQSRHDLSYLPWK